MQNLWTLVLNRMLTGLVLLFCSQDQSRLTEERQTSRQNNLTARMDKEEIKKKPWNQRKQLWTLKVEVGIVTCFKALHNN